MNDEIQEQDIWLAPFPYEEDPSIVKKRPVAIIDVSDPEFALCVKVTKAEPRDCYDTKIERWRVAKLNFPSTARSSKFMLIEKRKFIKRIGVMDFDDYTEVMNKFTRYVEDHR